MKAMILMGAMILSSISANADTNFSHQCKTDKSKDVEVAYSYSGKFSLNRVVIDGATYTDNSHLTVTGDGVAMVYVSNFRNGETLQLVVQGLNNSFYKLEGKERNIKCLTRTDSGGASGNNDI